MDKRERKTRLKEIIEVIDKSIIGIEKFDKRLMLETQKKIDDLYGYLDNHCIVPDGFDPDEMMKEILADYFNNDEEIMEIIGDIESLKEDTYDHIDEMRESSNKEEWEEFYSNLEYIDDVIDFEEQEISNVEEFIENMKELKSRLNDLM